MSTIVSSALIIDGEKILTNANYNVTIVQAIGNHNAFNIIFPANNTEGYAGALIDKAIQYVGKRIGISVNDGALEFVGIITAVDLKKGEAASGTIILSGFGSSILLSKSVQCFSYEEGTSFDQVVSETFRGHSTHFLRTAIGNSANFELPYTVQYNESDFEFLRRMCSRYGIWLYDNGTKLCVGRTQEKVIEGVYGLNISNFHLAANLQEQSFGIKAHDWVHNTPLEATNTDFNAPSSHPYFKQIKKESDLVFTKQGNYNWEHGQSEYSRQKGVDTTTKVNTGGKAASIITAKGSSMLVNLRVGDALNIEGLNLSDSSKKDPYGTYAITKVVHQFDQNGNYSNTFEGIPDAIEHPSYSHIFNIPVAEAQQGLVVDNADPLGLGRVKVQFKWQVPMNTTTPWIKMTTPYAGTDKGFYFIPEKGEEVLVGFQGGNPEKPYVLSAGYNTTAKSSFADKENNIKAIQSKSGNKVLMNDKDGSVTISDADGNMVVMSGNGEITISAKKKLTLDSEEINIIASKAVNVDGTNNVTITSKEVMIDGSSKATTNSATKIEIIAPNTQVEGATELKLKSDGILEVDGTTTTNVKGGLLNLN